MATSNDARLNFRLPAEIKQTIEQAAAHLGQSVTDFAVSALVQNARSVIREHRVTRLSNRDRAVFISMLDDTDIQPNKALTEAADKYKENSG